MRAFMVLVMLVYVVGLSAFPAFGRSQPQHWKITIRHSDTSYGQGEHYQLTLKGSAPDPDSCYRALMLDTNYGPLKIETPPEWGKAGFGCARVFSTLNAHLTVGANNLEESLGDTGSEYPDHLIIYKAVAKTVGLDVVDITNDIVEEPFWQLKIKVQPRPKGLSEKELRRRLWETERFSKDLGS